MGIKTDTETTQDTENTRLAPSPTGALHLGNARTFLINHALAVQSGWQTLLRIEDLDTPRVKPGVTERTIDTLRWLGLEWNAEAPLQSADLEPYRRAMQQLAELGLVYPCERTRGDIAAAASAPNEGDLEPRFGSEHRPTGFIRGKSGRFDREDINWRFAVEPGLPVVFHDEFAGNQSIDVEAGVGDFLVWTKRGQPSYQLAVVVDDARQGVTQVVRGDDLLPSAARQMLLWRALGFGAIPTQWHIPLVRGADGRRLAKRHGDTRIDHYRDLGVSSERVIGLIAQWCGLIEELAPMTTARFTDSFDIRTMSKTDIIFTEADDRWLSTC